MPTVFIAFGITGDLMVQKILPGLFALHSKGDLPENFEIWGVSRREWNDSTLHDHVRSALIDLAGHRSFNSFLERIRFFRGDTSQKAIFDTLAEALAEKQAVLFFSISPELYKEALDNLAASSLEEKSKQLRIMIEKPFGSSEATARELHHTLATTFNDEQVYRMDHYLAKEALSALPPIQVELLSKVEIYLLEADNVSHRGAFYDHAGALRDVGQNHMLEMFARAVMPDDRASALELLERLSPEEAAAQTTRAQYDGFTQAEGVSPDSQTETYFKITTKFKGAEVVFEGGKGLHRNRKEIVLSFQNGASETYPMGTNRERSEYEALVLECLRGEQSRFKSMREILASWRFIDPIEAAWAAGKPELKHYTLGADSVI